MRRRLWEIFLAMYLGVLPERSRKKTDKLPQPPEGFCEQVESKENITQPKVGEVVTTESLRRLEKKVPGWVSMSDTASTDVRALTPQPFCGPEQLRLVEPKAPDTVNEGSLFEKLLQGLKAMPDEPQFWWQARAEAEAAAASAHRLMSDVCGTSLVGMQLAQRMRELRGVEITPPAPKHTLPHRRISAVVTAPQPAQAALPVIRPSAVIAPVRHDDGYVYPYVRPRTTDSSQLQAVPARTATPAETARERARVLSGFVGGARRARSEAHQPQVQQEPSDIEVWRGGDSLATLSEVYSSDDYYDAGTERARQRRSVAIA